MLARYELEIMVVFVNVIMISALLTPHSLTVAVTRRETGLIPSERAPKTMWINVENDSFD